MVLYRFTFVYKLCNTGVGVGAGAKTKIGVGAQKAVSVGVTVLLSSIKALKTSSISSSFPVRRRLLEVQDLVI